MTSHIKKIAIVGATGHVGKEILNSLVKSNKHEITALTRDKNLNLPSSVSIAQIDYNDEATLVQALQGQELLIITLSVMAPKDTHSKLARAAAKAKVPYVMPNAWGFDTLNTALGKDIPAAQIVLNNIAELGTLGLSHITVVCNFWYEWSLSLGELGFGIDIANKKAVFFDDGNTKINTTTWEQCGRAVASLLSFPESGDEVSVDNWKNKGVYISSFRISQRDMLDSIHRVIGTTDKDWEIEYQDSKPRYEKAHQEMLQGDRMSFARAMYTRVFFPDGSGDYEGRRGVDNKVLDLPQEKLDEATKRTVDLVQSGWHPFGSH